MANVKFHTLQRQYVSWRGSRKTSKFVELSFQLGQGFLAQDNDRRRALETMKQGIDIAKDIGYKLKFLQMVNYGQWRSGLTAPRALAVPIILENYEKYEIEKFFSFFFEKEGENFHSYLWLH